ncbi:hypothetical protein MTR67_025961 [Solanum verrucosum]|uniref:Uncharacterized protein n=1 Tax=Solanum verrucosum TaxID=315347 RepID=A0AAF0R647_SOLVR|nr:hypothetical protein MTR67_025961 [Solanum verrucosum]
MVDPQKIEAVKNWVRPSYVIEIKSFCGDRYLLSSLVKELRTWKYEEEISEAVEAGEMIMQEVAECSQGKVGAGRGYKPKLAKVIYFMQGRKLVGQGCLAYLAQIRDVEVESPSIESIHVVSEFRVMFPTVLPSMPPDRYIDFCIDLETGTRPISIPLYRMALAELREIKAQIQELLDKGFIRPSASPWGCSYLVG